MTKVIKKVRHHILNPLRFFFSDSRAMGVILIFCTALSIFLANVSNNNGWYTNLWNTEWHAIASFHLPESFSKWINDFFMAFFFLLAGMEIKRELISGELSSFKKAVLPFGAALGGMLVPALIFTFFNHNTPYAHGWGIPTATDIAFSIGIASLFGNRIPVGLKILLMALAIIDDLGAIVVIALFYGGQVQWIFLAVSGILYAILIACNYFKVKFGIIQVVISALLWYCMFNSGIEASITGVLIAFALPLDIIPKVSNALHKYVNFLIIPLFALANTAIIFNGSVITSMTTTVGMGVIFGLVVGKPVGIFLISRLLVALKIAKLPQNVQWNQVFGMGILAGIGFTMSIFTTALAFSDNAHKDIAKIAILASVLISLVASWAYFVIISARKVTVHIPEMATESYKPELSMA